jgi:hypothetical protein
MIFLRPAVASKPSAPWKTGLRDAGRDRRIGARQTRDTKNPGSFLPGPLHDQMIRIRSCAVRGR